MTIDELEKLEDLLDEFQANVMQSQREKIATALEVVRREIRSRV